MATLPCFQGTLCDNDAFQVGAIPLTVTGQATGLAGGCVESQVFADRTFQYQAFAYTPFVTATEVITVDKWFQSFTNPVRLNVLATAQQQTLASVPFNEDFRIEAKWHFPWSEPVRLKPRATEFQSYTSGWDSTLEPGQSYVPWFTPLSEPVRLKPRATEFQAYTSGWSGTLEPGAAYTPWFSPLSEPVRLKPRATEFQAYTSGWDSTLEPGQAYMPWFSPWSDPVRLRAKVAANQDEFWGVFTSAPETITVDKWFEPLSEPAKPKTSVGTASQQVLASVPFNEDFGIQSKWFQPWSDPVRLVRRVAQNQYESWGVVTPATVAGNATGLVGGVESISFGDKSFQYQSLAYTQVVQAAEVITVDKWFIPYQDPVRVKPSLRTGDNQDLFFDPQPFVSFSWFNWLNDPVRLKPGLAATEQQFLAFDPFPFTKMDWFNWLNEPVRLKLGLLVTEQSSFTAGFVPIIPSVTNWYRPFNEPVRFRVFGTHLQKDTVFPYQNLATVIRFSRGYIIC